MTKIKDHKSKVFHTYIPVKCSKVSTIEDLKNELHTLEKKLIEEKMKSKALSQEIENPINLHRWRKLEATDSEFFELLTKVQTVQKRLIAKTDEVLVFPFFFTNPSSGSQ